MKEYQVDRDTLMNSTEILEQVESIAKATKLGLATEYARVLSDDDMSYVLDGIVKLLSPLKDMLYDIREVIDTSKNEKVIIK